MIDTLRRASAAVALLALSATTVTAAGAAVTARDKAVPHYDHIFVIVEENKGYETIMKGGAAPNIVRLARKYGSATQMYGEIHPSQGNYVALVGGDTFGIRYDDPWSCVPGPQTKECEDAAKPDFVAPLVNAPNLGTQLRAKGLDWRAYLEDLPTPGSLAAESTATQPLGVYASKHAGFINYQSTIADLDKAKRLVGFDALHADLKSGNVPAFALVIPNMCNEMHGMPAGDTTPADCAYDAKGLIPRGDALVGKLVDEIQASPLWKAPGKNNAIVITWDENDRGDRATGKQSCCVVDKNNPGGGHIATVVVTNRGPRGVTDPTSYNHYSLLRTIEDALGLGGHLRHADDDSVLPMTPLFALAAKPQ